MHNYLAQTNCGQLSSPLNGHVFYEYTIPGSEATYICDTGFVLVGIPSRFCSLNSNWSGSEPVCKGMLMLSFHYNSCQVCYSNLHAESYLTIRTPKFSAIAI